jgi:hypothetical protein
VLFKQDWYGRNEYEMAGGTRLSEINYHPHGVGGMESKLIVHVKISILRRKSQRN